MIIIIIKQHWYGLSDYPDLISAEGGLKSVFHGHILHGIV